MKTSEAIKYLFLIIGLSLALSVLPAKGQNDQTVVTLTWSTNTYTPNGYLAKALPTIDSQVEIVATIDDPAIDPQKLTYVWSFSKNYYLQEKIIEKGKQIFNFKMGNSFNNLYTIEVTIQDEEESIIGQSAPLAIKPVRPEIILQASQTANGIQKRISPFDNTDLNFKKYQILSNQTIKLVARPYFFNIKNVDDLSYDWSFGREKASQSSSENPNIFKLKIGQMADTIGQNVKLDVENKDNSRQKASAEAQINLTP